MVEVFADIKAISAQLSWRLAGWLWLSLAIISLKNILFNCEFISGTLFFSCNEQLKKLHCHSVRLFVRLCNRSFVHSFVTKEF